VEAEGLQISRSGDANVVGSRNIDLFIWMMWFRIRISPLLVSYRSHSHGNELMGSREIHRSGQITPFTIIRSTRYVSLPSSFRLDLVGERNLGMIKEGGREMEEGGRRKNKQGELTNRNRKNINSPSSSPKIIRNSIQETYTRIKRF
jgi:hypothetical protein